MKRILTILAVISLVATTSSSVIACGAEKTPNQLDPTQIRLNNQVSKDLGLTDVNGKSLVEIGINGFLASDYVKWDFKGKNPHNPFSNNITGIKASILLKPDNEAISLESEYFLINSLKLVKDSQNKFNRFNANSITVSISKIFPNLSKKQDNSDYIITGGNFKLQFMKGTEKLGNNYTVDLKKDNVDIIQPIFETLFIDHDSFDNQIPDFIIGKDNKKPIDGTNLYTYFKTDDRHGVYKKLQSLKNLINKGDVIAIKVSSRTIQQGQSLWQRNDSLNVKVHFGSIVSNISYPIKLL